jgi:16S rRNA (guanine527-N7)-methyltransferase
MTNDPSFVELLMREFSRAGTLTGVQLARLEAHYQLLCRWNERLNLTAIRDMKTAVVRHYCESLWLGMALPEGAYSIADIGSGGGFPGIPISVLRPECRVVLVESHLRKSVFLREATRDWRNVEVFSGRAEALTGDLPWVISRAVRWQDVVKVARHGIGMLMSAADAADLTKRAEFQWEEPLAVPWSPGHVVVLGSRVPRGT